MGQSKCKEQITERAPEVDEWQVRSPIERRSDRASRRKKSMKYFKGGRERRTGKERRCAEERRDKWMRIGKWRSESVFDE